MRVGPIVHGALLVAALGFAYQTWTREKSETPKVGTVTVWDEPIGDFEAFAYDGESKSVRVERREEGGQSYYWGQVTRAEKKKKPLVPVKSPAEGEGGPAGGPHGGHGGPGAGMPPKPPTPPGPGGKATPATPATPGAGGAKAEPPAKGGTEAGKDKAAPPATSPHHARTDQPEKPAAAPAAKPAAAPAAKPAATPAAKPAATPAAKPAAAPAAKPADQGAGAAAEPDGDEEGDDEDSSAPAADLGAAPEPTTSKVKEFPIGKAGQEMIASLVHLHALRDLGVLTDQQKEEYELASAKENLTVFFKNGKQHSLIIGARVFGGSDRYVLHSESGRGYVLSNSEIMRHIDGAENSLGLKVLHSFQDEPEAPDSPPDPKGPKPKRDKYPGVDQVDVETPSGSRSLVRYEQADKQTGGTVLGWADKKKPGETDVTFGNFLTQIERLRPVEYDPSLEASSLTKVLTLRYTNEGGQSMGTFELYRKDPSVTPELQPSEDTKKDNQADYYVKTELTRVFGKVGRMSAERVTEDLPQLFGAPPKKKEDAGSKAPAHLGAPGAAPADNPAKPTTDKTNAAPEPPRPASKPAGSNPNPSPGNK